MKRDVAVALVLFALALWQNLSDLRLTPFHPDETRWLNRAHYVRDLADPFGPTWEDGYLTRGQPPLGSYLMGLGLLAQGRDLETNGVWNFRYGTDWNTARGNMASQADLDAGRRTNAVVGALTVVVVYVLGKRLTNRVGGIAGALFLAAHPLMISLSSQAVSDALLALLLALAALAACRLADRPSWPRALLLGALLGLGGATKLSPLLLTLPLAALGVGFLARAWWARRQPVPAEQAREPLGWKLAALPLIAAVVFVAVYPYLWPDPIGRTGNLFAFRVQEMAGQGANWEDVAVRSRTEAFRRVGVTLGHRFTTTGRLASKLAHGLGLQWHPRGIDLPLALIGAEVLVALAVWRGPRSRHALALLVLGGQVGLIVLGLRSDYARYHLPVLLAAAVCLGVVTAQGWRLAVCLAAHARLRDRFYAGLDRILSGGAELVPPNLGILAVRGAPAGVAAPSTAIARRRRSRAALEPVPHRGLTGGSSGAL